MGYALRARRQDGDVKSPLQRRLANSRERGRLRFCGLAVGGAVEPEVDGALGAGGGRVWERDFAAFAGGGVAGVEGFHHDEAVFAGGLEFFFAADAAGEMRELLRRAVIPEFFEDGVRPTFCGRSFFDSVAVAVFAEGGHGVAHVEIGVAATGFAEDFDLVVHAAAARPAIFDEGDGAVFEFQDAKRIVVGFRFSGVDVGAHLAVDGFDGRAAEEPIGEGDTVAAEIHERAAAAAIDVPEPFAVRAEMLFALLDEINFAEGAGVGHFFDFEIFRREEKLFTVHQEDAGLFCGGDHFFALGDGHGERLFADDVLPYSGGVFGHLAMKAVGSADADDFDGGIFEHFAIVGVGAGNVEALGEMFGVAGSGRGDGDEFGFVGHDLKRGGVDVGLELRADDADFYFGVGVHLRSLNEGIKETG